MQTKALIVLLASLMAGCMNLDGGWIKMTVLQGEHYVDNRPIWKYQRHYDFEVRFDHTVVTDTVINQINKVFGMSDSYDHRRHSLRLGYRWMGKYIGMYIYARADGKPDWNRQPIYKAKPNEVMRGSLTILEFYYEACINGNCHRIKRTQTRTPLIRYRLYHHFGGRTPAPHDTHVYIRFINHD